MLDEDRRKWCEDHGEETLRRMLSTGLLVWHLVPAAHTWLAEQEAKRKTPQPEQKDDDNGTE